MNTSPIYDFFLQDLVRHLVELQPQRPGNIYHLVDLHRASESKESRGNRVQRVVKKSRLSKSKQTKIFMSETKPTEQMHLVQKSSADVQHRELPGSKSDVPFEKPMTSHATNQR